MRIWAEKEDEGELDKRMAMLAQMKKSLDIKAAGGGEGPLIEEVKKGKTMTLE